VSEDRSMLADDAGFDPTTNRISYNLGHFAISAAHFSRFQYLLNPMIPQSGYLSTTRDHYRSSYPRAAIQ
jgi:hypothetical protein